MGKKEEKVSFLIRWVTCSIGLWIAVRLFGGEYSMSWWQEVLTFLLAGLIFSIVNSVIRPLVVILSLPFVLVTMGLFMLLINGFMVWLAILLAPNIKMDFGWAIISSLVISLINYIVSGFSDFNKEEKIS
ncbi:phage holin family protein [Candidatus Saccharibacteria bacterium]|nr:phage holin family protein [Candidatus Saccharibacteria bacterium]MCL1962925.1 phage holin family protein [Candidatus Saccharibacteria bacterium]